MTKQSRGRAYRTKKEAEPFVSTPKKMKTRYHKPKFLLYSRHLESVSVKGDKITIHKCVIDKAIKSIKRAPSDNRTRDTGMIMMLEEMLELIHYGKSWS